VELEDWETLELGKFVTLQRGHDLPDSHRKPGNIPVIGSFGVTGYHDTSIAKGPGVTVGRSGASFGVVTYSPVDFWPHNACLYVINFHGNDEKFAYYLLKTLDFSSFNSGSAQPSLNRNYIHPIKIKVPPLHEQYAIAQILGSLDDKIELNRRMNHTLEAIAAALFKEWFVENEESNGWALGTIRDVCTKVENGGTPRRDQKNYWEPGTIPWLTSGEVRQEIVISTDNRITPEGLKNSSAKLWPKGTTVIALYGATAGQASFTALELCANQACCGLIPKDGYQYFIYLVMASATNSLALQARGSAQQNLSQQIVADFSIRIPDEGKLTQFNIIASPLFERWIANLIESGTLAELRDTLLPKLMSGEVKVRTAD
jgi:type I restriction enzyme, S subunit